MCGDDHRRRLAAAALPHINLLLAVMSGAALAMSARLKWDPSAYIPLRELLPLEYSVGVLSLPSLALVLLLLGHLAHVATPPRRGLLYLYAALMLALVVAEVVFVVLVWRRVDEWLRSPAYAAVANMQRELSDHLLPLLDALSRLYPLPTKLTDLIEEAKADLPRNGYVAGAAAALLLLLQLAGATAALLLASRGPDGSTRGSFTQVNRRRARGEASFRNLSGSAAGDPRPLRAYAYESAAGAGPAPAPRRSLHAQH